MRPHEPQPWRRATGDCTGMRGNLLLFFFAPFCPLSLAMRRGGTRRRSG